jgi:hypothetical protein
MRDYREYHNLEPQDFVRIHEQDLKRLEAIESALRTALPALGRLATEEARANSPSSVEAARLAKAITAIEDGI